MSHSSAFNHAALAHIVEASGIPMLVASTSGKVAWANRAFTELTGFRIEELAGSQAQRFGTASPSDYEEIELAIRNGRNWRQRAWTSRRDGSLYLEETVISPVADPAAQTSCCLIVKQDVTAASERLELAVEAGGIGMWDWDLQSGSMFFSRKFQEMLGFSAREPELTGTACRDLLHPDDAASVKDALYDCLSGSRPVFDAVFRMRHKDGRYLHLHGRGRLSRDADGDPLRFIGIFTDATEYVRLAHERRQSEKMELLGLLAAGIAHDFNNLLTIINGHASLLADHLDHEETARQYVDLIASAGDRAASLVRRLLVFSRHRPEEQEIICLNDAIAESAKFVKGLLPGKITLVTRSEPELRPVRIDPGMMQQVLLNLIVNARDAMPFGGTISIEAKNVELPHGLAEVHAILPPGAYVEVCVTDTGAGMQKDVLQKLFEPFFTTKAEGEGTGIGLATVYRIAKQAGGGISVQTRAGCGSTFRVYLPAAETMISRTASAAVPVQDGHETILLVDHSDAVRDFSAAALRKFGYTVVAASSAREAEEMARTQTTIHAAVVDLALPDAAGEELADRLRERRPDLPVLFVSGYAPVHSPTLARDACFLSKPFTANVLAGRLREMLGDRRRCVLVVDDDPDILDLAESILRRAGFDVITASNGRGALSIIGCREVDVVVTDLVMPEVEGLELIEMLRKNHPSLPVVAISGAFSGHFLHAARLLGANLALQKPFSPEQLTAIVRRALLNEKE